MIIVKELYHICSGLQSALRELKWDRGGWWLGIKKIEKCPYCKEVMPHVTKLNKVETEDFSWNMGHMESEPILYKGIVLSVKEPIKRKKLSK